ncbi:aldo-keto reductase [Penicillium lagena]|uniref:aldo-keto reductase n=1 Tax=Penicillium lagena TaxID=94218 RepID=UPI0025410A35|nr:aldo-keto reductase [Penicillium lagena]KAJ5620702.1 aldo-keto reductase [Penicillium lagena]
MVPLPTRSLGRNGPLVPRLGLGLMGISGTYGLPSADTERLAFLDEAYEKGERFWDTANKYGDSEELLGKWFAANPDKRQDIFLATKFGIKPVPGGKGLKGFTIDSTPEYCRECIDTSLERLGLPYVDLYYIHRLDKVTPIEKTMRAMVQLKNAGKIKYLGLSECSAESLRRAHAVHPISCVQVEYSPFCTAIESPTTQLLETARELGVAVVAYSPLGNGVLGGKIRSREDVTRPGDTRGILPWLWEENVQTTVRVVDQIAEIAKTKGVTTAQLALAWLLKQGDDIFPIPGSSKLDRLEENLGSLSVSLSDEEEESVRQLAKGVVGERFQTMSGYAFADTPPLED